MGRVALLYTGEWIRMRKYGITAASLITAVLWIAIVQISGISNVTLFFPLVLFLDATLMSLLLAGVTMIFERQENALQSIIVTPIAKEEYLIAKVLAVATSSLITFLLLLVYGTLFWELSVHALGMAAGVLLIAIVFGELGIVMTYYARDFTGLLTGMAKFMFLFAIPTMLETFQVISGDWLKTIQYFNPTKNALVLLQAAVGGVESADLWIAILYLAALGAGLYVVTRRLFDRYAASQGGA